MEQMPLKLSDLSPKDTPLILSTRKDKPPLTIGRWSLRVRTWASDKYTPERLNKIFTDQEIGPICDIAYFMLREKTEYKTIEDFQDDIVTVEDQINLVKSLLGAVGVGEPEIEKINKALKDAGVSKDPNVKAPKKKIGAKSSTP